MLSLCFSRLTKAPGIVTLISLFFILTFRSATVGTDTETYINHFYHKYIHNGDFSFAQVEVGYDMLVKFLRIINSDGYGIITSLSIITFLFLILSFKKLKVDLAYGLCFYVLLGFYFYAFNGARQLAAISILLYTYTLIVTRDKKFKILFFLILSVSFHKSTLFFFPLIFVPNKVMSYSLVKLLVCISFIMFWTGAEFLTNLIGYYLGDLYNNYSDIFEESSSTSISGKLYYSLILIAQLFIYEQTKNSVNSRLVNLYVLSLCMFLLFKNMHPYLNRILFNITIIQVVYYALFFYNYKLNSNNKRVIFTSSLFILFILLFYGQYSVLLNNVGEIIPYSLRNIF